MNLFNTLSGQNSNIRCVLKKYVVYKESYYFKSVMIYRHTSRALEFSRPWQTRRCHVPEDSRQLVTQTVLSHVSWPVRFNVSHVCRVSVFYVGEYLLLKYVSAFANLGTTPKNQNCIREEIKSRLKSGNASWFVLLIKYFLGDQIKMNGMGRACGTYGREERCIQEFRRETWIKETI
jgi:hypothetical protein